MSMFKQPGRTERATRVRRMIGGRSLLRGLVAVTAVAGVAAWAATSAVPALADAPLHPTTTLTLSFGTGGDGQWVATGTDYAPGLSDVKLGVDELLPGAGWTTIDYQTGLTTSSRSIAPYNPGGLLSVLGNTIGLALPPPGFSEGVSNPPQRPCVELQAFTWDPIDGFEGSNILSTCS